MTRDVTQRTCCSSQKTHGTIFRGAEQQLAFMAIERVLLREDVHQTDGAQAEIVVGSKFVRCQLRFLTFLLAVSWHAK